MKCNIVKRCCFRVQSYWKINSIEFFELNKNTERERIPTFLEPIDRDKDVGLLSEAGVPCVADPGTVIVDLAHQKNIEVIPGDCVITNTGRVGAVAQIPKNHKFAIGRNMTAVRANHSFLTPTYLLNYLLSHYMEIETYRKTDIGTILDSLNVKGIKKILIIVPPIELLRIYESFARPIRQLIELSLDNK